MDEDEIKVPSPEPAPLEPLSAASENECGEVLKSLLAPLPACIHGHYDPVTKIFKPDVLHQVYDEKKKEFVADDMKTSVSTKYGLNQELSLKHFFYGQQNADLSKMEDQVIENALLIGTGYLVELPSGEVVESPEFQQMLAEKKVTQ